jgi:hypothetical protein
MTDERLMLQQSVARGIPRRWMPRGAELRQAGSVPPAVRRDAGTQGCTMEYPIAESCVDARVQRIHGGTNEIMKELAARFM